MNAQRLAVLLSATNLVILLLALTQLRAPADRSASPLIRGQALELVDDAGQVRSRLNVEPNGEVVLRLFDRHGTIRVKLGAGDDGSGLLLVDESTEPGVQMVARRTGTADRPTTTSLTLRGADGRQRVVSP